MLESLYYLCVDFMVAFANLFDMTYRDANMLILFGFIPLVLAADVLILVSAICKRVFDVKS